MKALWTPWAGWGAFVILLLIGLLHHSAPPPSKEETHKIVTVSRGTSTVKVTGGKTATTIAPNGTVNIQNEGGQLEELRDEFVTKTEDERKKEVMESRARPATILIGLGLDTHRTMPITAAYRIGDLFGINIYLGPIVTLPVGSWLPTSYGGMLYFTR